MKAACCVLLLLLVALPGPATCLLVKKHVYVDRLLSWTEARSYCKTHYVDLSAVTTQAEYDILKKNSSEHRSLFCWIGLSKQETEEGFAQWSDGSLIGFKKWHKGEPNKPGNEHCVNSKDDEWYSTVCSLVLTFFCYTWEPRVIVVQEMMTWMEALEHCRSFYTDLMSLNTENDLLITTNKSLSIQAPRVWIGLRFLDGSWVWVNKEPLENLIQLPSCPVGPLVCAARKVGEDVWENRDCEEKMNFICYHQ